MVLIFVAFCICLSVCLLARLLVCLFVCLFACSFLFVVNFKKEVTDKDVLLSCSLA